MIALIWSIRKLRLIIMNSTHSIVIYIDVKCHRRFSLFNLNVCSLKWLTLLKKTKTISFSHVIKIYKSKFLDSLQIIFFYNFCFQHMITSFITSVVVCIIDYNTTIIKINQLCIVLHWRKSINFFCRFRFFVDAVKSWRQSSFIWLCKISLLFHSILFFFLVVCKRLFSLHFVHCTSVLLI